MGYLLYREIRDFAPAEWTSGERLVALMIADDANDDTRRSWISARLLCQRTGMQPSGIKAALQKLASRGYEMRVPHGSDSLGRPVYAVRGHATDYLVPDILTVIGGAAAPPLAVDKPAGRRGHGPAKEKGMAGPQHLDGGATAPDGGAVASHGGAAAPPLSSGLLTIPSEIPSVPDDLEVGGPVESSRPPPDQDHESILRGRRHMTRLEEEAWRAARLR